MLKSILVVPMFVAVLTLSAAAAELNDYNPYDYNIPDNCSNVNSDLLLSGAPSDAQITKVRTYFEVNHSRWSDLTIWLTTYYGGSWHDRILYSQGSLSGSGTLARTIDNMYTWNGASPNQTWYLGVRDCVTGQTGYIAFFELWVTYEANEAPNTPYNPDPYDGETNVPRTADLDWNCSDPNGDVIYYTVYFEKNDSSPDNIVKNDATGSSVTLSTLDYDSHYYWRVRADDHNGGVTLGPVWDFYTEPAPVIDAEIVVLSIPDAIAGETISIPYQVTNTGNTSASFGVGAEIWLNGSRLDDLGPQYTSTISPGNTYNGSYSYPIPSHWETNTYVARVAVWTGAPGSSTQLDTYDRSFHIEGQSISAEITNVSYDKSVVMAGTETISADITVNNTGNQAWTFWVGASSIMDGGADWYDWQPERAEIYLTPGMSGTVTLTWSPDGTVPAGTYGFYSKVFMQNTGTDFVDEYWQATAFTVEAPAIDLLGRISFHSYSDYLAEPINSTDGNVFVYSFNSQSKDNITGSLPIDNAMNAHFSSDGSRIVFMAIPEGAARNWTQLEIYLYDLSRNQLNRLTTNVDIPDEDPKFSPDNRSIVFKRSGQIYTMRTDGSNILQITTTPIQKSGPNYSPNGAKIVYWSDVDENADIWWMNSDGSSNAFLDGITGYNDYYPIFRDNEHVMYTRSLPGLVKDDIIMYDVVAGSSSSAAFNRSESEDSDPFPINESVIGYSCWTENDPNEWDILIGDPISGQTVSPVNLNSNLKDIGGWYSPFNYARSVVVIEPSDGSEFEPGQSVILSVSAWSDGGIWSNANPSIVVDGPVSIEYSGLSDNGTNGDAVAGDGVYSATVTLPSTIGDYTLTALATSSDNGISNQIESAEQPAISIKEATGSLQVNIEPADAANSGAQWRVDGGTWHNSGDTQTDLATGEHDVEFSTIADWTTPNPQTVTINNDLLTTATGTYVPHTGTLTVTISPQGAVDAGAKWRRVGSTTWQNSGFTETSIPVGSYTVEFSDISYWTTPSNQPVTISHNGTNTLQGTYTQEVGSILVTIEPQGVRDAGAQWQIDEGPWRNSGVTNGGIPVGEHTVDFKPVDCWVTPNPIIVQINAGLTTLETGTYIEEAAPSPPTITCTPGCGNIQINLQAANSANYPVVLSLFNGPNQLWTQSIAPGGSVNHSYTFNAPTTGEYCFTAAISSICGDSDPSVCCATPVFPLPPPTSFSSWNGCNSVTYLWGAVSGAEGYCVYINGDSVWSGTETSHEFTGLEPVVHMFTVASYNECGPGNQSTGLGKTPLAIPEVPSWCSATSDRCGYISISWENVGRDGGYVIYRDGGSNPIDSTGHDVTSYVDSVTGVHEYSVSAFNYTCGESDTSEIATGTGRTSPTGAQPAIAPLVNKIEIDWLADPVASSYELTISPPTPSNDTILTISEVSYSFELPTDSAGLAQSGLYWVALICMNDCGRSDSLVDSVELYHIGGEVLYTDPGDNEGPYWVFIGTQEGLRLSTELSAMDSTLTNDSGSYRFVIPAGSYRVWCELDTLHVQEVDVVDTPVDDVNLDVTTSVQEIDTPELPNTFSLFQNYPNPFNPQTQIEFEIPRASFVEIHIYNILGKQLRSLVSERLSAGRKVVTWDGTDDRGMSVSSGIYFYQIRVESYAEARKMLLLK